MIAALTEIFPTLQELVEHEARRRYPDTPICTTMLRRLFPHVGAWLDVALLSDLPGEEDILDPETEELVAATADEIGTFLDRWVVDQELVHVVPLKADGTAMVVVFTETDLKYP